MPLYIRVPRNISKATRDHMGNKSQAIVRSSAGLLVGACTMAGALFLAAASASADSLEGVVREALETNPELAAIRYNRQAIDEELRAARGLGLPSVDLRAKNGRRRDSLKTPLGVENTDTWHNSRDVSLSLSQRLFDGFERDHEVARQKNRVESARWRVADTANSIALRTVQAYFETQRAASVLAAARRNLSALMGLRARVLDRVDSGLGNVAEETEAGSRVAQAKAIVAEAEGRLADATALFRATVGRAPGRLQAVRVPYKALPGNVEAAVAAARAAAPSVIATQHDAVAARAAVGSAYSRLYPKLNFEVSTLHGRGTEEADDRDLEMRAMFVVRWSLFNGGINKARIREAYARSNEAVEISANTERVVERETRVSWNAIQAARARIPALRRQLQLARQTRSTYSEQFDVGARRLLDLLDAQSEVFLADAALRTEEFVGQFNTYRVFAAMGRLVDVLGVGYPVEAAEPHAKWRIEGVEGVRSPQRWWCRNAALSVLEPAFRHCVHGVTHMLCGIEACVVSAAAHDGTAVNTAARHASGSQQAWTFERGAEQSRQGVAKPGGGCAARLLAFGWRCRSTFPSKRSRPRHACVGHPRHCPLSWTDGDAGGHAIRLAACAGQVAS